MGIRGIDSNMESGWIGGGLAEQEQADDDGRHLFIEVRHHKKRA